VVRPVELDIVELLRRDHEDVRSTLTRIAAGSVLDRWATFSVLTDLVIRHEVAEELVVYPALLSLRGGGAVADSRLDDQAEVERLLIALDREEFDTHEFEVVAARLGLEVLGHLDKEDAQVLPLLATKLSARQRTELGRRFVEVKLIAPARHIASGARLPKGRTVMDRTSVVSTWMRDSAAFADRAS